MKNTPITLFEFQYVKYEKKPNNKLDLKILISENNFNNTV